MNIAPEAFFSLLSHPLRLRSVILLRHAQELCVCDPTRILNTPQPLMSRHLGALRESELVVVRREGLWMHYSVNPALPSWAMAVIDKTSIGVENMEPYMGDRARLNGQSSARYADECA